MQQVGMFKELKKIIKKTYFYQLFHEASHLLTHKKWLYEASSFEYGFHGDRYLMELADFFLLRSRAFVETGAFAGTTTCYVARKFPDIEIYSCEPHNISFKHAVSRCRKYRNINIAKMPSPKFLYELFARLPSIKSQFNTYFLDAHEFGFDCPIIEEMRFLTNTAEIGAIIIDDFKVPGKPEFGYYYFEGQEYSFDLIKNSLCKDKAYAIIYPAYTERTSQWHPLTGACVIVFGIKEFLLPENLSRNFSIRQIND
jgi:hypothetical protein